MPKFAANISTMFQEHPFADRFQAAADAGFTAVECTFPYQVSTNELQEKLHSCGLNHLLINGPPGDLQKGERGFAALPGRVNEFRESIEQALQYATALHCPYIHVMAGIMELEHNFEEHQATYIENLQHAGAIAALEKKTILIEPINTFDNPSYFMNNPQHAITILQQVGLPNVRLQFDFYHTQMMLGHLEYNFKKYLPHIAHVQISGMPHRQEPDTGEINFFYLLTLLDQLDYQGWVGLEYTPRGNTLQGLSWMEDMQKQSNSIL